MIQLATRYKFIQVIEISRTIDGKGLFRIESNKTKDILGFINWYPAWKKYIFSPCYDTIWSDDCLTCIIQFIKRLK